ncbi:MAG: PQQ-dependent sugar dehydrogenase [Oligoflexus sp.]|nr:PQQ-dependent sugar dehydrogenase [Oligoflexus sp.]
MARSLVALSVVTAVLSLSACGQKSRPLASGSILKDDAIVREFTESTDANLDARPTNNSCLAFARPTENTSIKLQRLDSNSFDQIVEMVQAPQTPGRFYAVRRTGQIESFVGDGAKSMFLDLSNVVNSRPSEGGLLGMAWNPAKKGEFYLSYTLPSSASPANLRSTIARFQTDSETGALYKPEILVSFEQPYENHNGGHIAFGKDGYLYIGFGDGGSGGDPLNNAQNLNVLFGKILRIDISNPGAYTIPKDNPFVGQPNTKPEIYAYGVRNPWRFQFDRATGDLWLGDVGQNLWEEVDKVTKGGNYGWNIREGFNCYENKANCGNGNFVEPVIQYGHNEGASISGGFVYRGKALPSLQGTYIFGDFMSGNIWGLFPDQNGKLQKKLLIATGFNIPGFGEDENGEIYVLEYGAGRVHRIVAKDPNAAVIKAPELLSKTGCFNPARPTEPVSGLIPYNLNSPLWSDASQKRRWLALPEGTKINVADNGRFEFPNGSVLVKEFSLKNRPVETRLFVRHVDGSWIGYTYAWKDDGSDADLVNGGASKVFDGQTWNYPTQAQCLQCHTANAGYSLGLEISQLNRKVGSAGNERDQLATFEKIGLFTKALPEVKAALPVPATAEGADLAARAYIHSNCSFCHRPGGTGGGNLDMRFETELKNTGLCNKPGSGDLGINDARIVFPGAPEKSVLFNRISRRGTQQMPPLATTMVDEKAQAFIKNWISTMQDCPQGGGPVDPGVKVGDVISLEARHSNKCMDLDNGNGADGARIHQWTCNGSQNQKFRVEAGLNAGLSLVNVKTNKCVDVSKISGDNGALVQQWSCANAANQTVAISPSVNGSVTLKFQHSGKCLEVAGNNMELNANIQQRDCDQGANQDWFIRR